MKYRVTAMLALAAALAVPSLASAATMRDNASFTSASATSPTVVIPRDRNDDAAAILMNAEHNYLANTCPAVLHHPGAYSGVLDRFCREFRG